MASPKTQPWSVQKCAKNCVNCQTPFQNRQPVFSTLLPDEHGEYFRDDFCQTCWRNKTTHAGISHWKTLFYTPPPKEEIVKKENAESLLRKLLKKEEAPPPAILFILAVMLERKKLLIERDIQNDPTGQKWRVYEHRKTSEFFLIPDPALHLDQLEEIQIQVAQLLKNSSLN